MSGNTASRIDRALENFKGLVDGLLAYLEDGSYPPVLKKIQVKIVENGDVYFKFTYDQNGRKTALILPVYSSLVDDFTNCAPEEPEVDNESLGFIDRIKDIYHHPYLSFIYHRATMSLLGISSLLNLVHTFKPFGIAFKFLSFSAGISGNIAIMTASILYAMPIIANYVKEKYLQRRKEIRELCSEVEADFEAGRRGNLYERLDNLSWQHRIILHERFPNNRKLRWHIRYLRDYDNAFLHSLELAATREEKILAIRRCINETERFFKSKLQEIEGSPIFDSGERYAAAYKGYRRALKADGARLPQMTPRLMEEGKDLTRRLQQCIAKLRSLDRTGALDIFDGINLEGFYKVMFPRAAIIYRQLEVYFLLAGHQSIGNRPGKYKSLMDTFKAERDLRHMSEDISEYAAHKFEDFKTIFEHFMRGVRTICRNEEQKPKVPLFGPPVFPQPKRPGPIITDVTDLADEEEVEQQRSSTYRPS